MAGQSGVSPEVVPLPSGGGAIRGIGETFAPDLHTGTGSYRIPLFFPRGPGRFQPEMALVYSSSGGNGPFGMGWLLPQMQIARSSERGLPRYDDSDILLLDRQELVPVGGGRYRHRREEHFMRVERQGEGWDVRDRSARRFILGSTGAARIEHAVAGAARTVAWLIERVIDANGNEIRYSYRRDRGQLYLERIAYGNCTVDFTYEGRTDVLTDRRPGFEVSTALRCTGIEYRLIDDADPLFRTYAIAYDECPYSGLSLLASVRCTGRRTAQGGEEIAALPTLWLGYTRFEPGRRHRSFASASNAPPPGTLADATYDLVDLDGTGLPGVIELDGVTQRFWPNEGRGRWGPPRSLRRTPATLTLANPAIGIADMDGDGAADLLLLAESPLGYLRNEPGQGWVRRARFRTAPAFDLADLDVRLIDFDGDGLVDAMRTGQRRLYLYRNLGASGWAEPVAVARRHDLAEFPDVFFSDPRVKLADMTGDGIVDIVWVHGSRLDYWPHFGNGRFGPRVTLALKPSIAARFDPERLSLTDVNGDGLADVVYVEDQQVRVWINQAGAALRVAAVVRHTPPVTPNNVAVADMMGTGTWGLLWSFPASRQEPGNYKYLDFTTGVRPYLLSSIDDGTGLVTEVEYRPSTEHAIEAAERGTPWQSSPPFPVQTVSRLTQRDALSGASLTRIFRYYDGYFDGHDREFRGFARAETLEEGDASAAPGLIVSHFYQGRRGETPGETQEERRALAGRLRRVEVLSPDGSALAAVPFRVEENRYHVRTLAVGINGVAVSFPHLAESIVTVSERTAQSLTDRTVLEWDDFGNPVEKREEWDAAPGTQHVVSRMRYTVDTDRWILGLPVEMERRDTAGALLSLERYYYDGPSFVGLPLGRVERGNLVRREAMVVTDAAVADVYGAAPPDHAALGYHRITARGGEQGWGIDALRLAHDAQGNVDRRQDSQGHTGRTLYDARGIHPTAAIDPLGRAHAIAYDARSGQVARVSEPNGHETRYHYDAVGRLTAVVKPGDADALPTTSFEYLDAQRPLGVRTRLRQEAGDEATTDMVEYFDGFGRSLQRRSAAEGGEVVVDGFARYNVRGWLAERTSPFVSAGFAYVPGEGALDARRCTFRYDAMGRVVETFTPDGRPSGNAYAPGTITRFDVSDRDASPENVARGHFDTPRTERYDARGRLLAVTERNSSAAPAATTTYTHDALGRVLRLVDPRGIQVARYTYDLLGRKIRSAHVDAGVHRAFHDADGHLAATIAPGGTSIETSHDALGRPLERRIGGVLAERYHYDAGAGANLVGRLARVEDEAGEIDFSYTPRGLIAEKTRRVPTLAGVQSFAVRYRYDSAERMTQLTYPDGAVVKYRYSTRGLTQAIDGVVERLDYNALGQLVGVRYVNGVEETHAFDPHTFFLNESRVDGPSRPEPYYHMTYAYDAVGNPLSIQDEVVAAGHRRFQRQLSYDALYRLRGITGDLDGVAFARQYAHDSAGNFTRNDEFRPEPVFLDPAGSNRVRGVRIGGVDTPLFDYDTAGNTTVMPGLALDWDSRGRLVRVQRGDGAVIAYAYGFEGERVRARMTHGGVTTETIYVDRLYEVRNGSVTRFVFNEDVRVAAMSGGGQQRFFHRDHVGSTVLVTGGGGEILHELDYFPFGTPAFSRGAGAAAFGFLGNEMDQDTGLVYCRSRYYDPRLGRFLSPDLLVVLNPDRALHLPGALNSYVYAANNPVRLVDSDGAWWKWLVGGLLIAALVVATVLTAGVGGFAFGLLLAATIGSTAGAGVGVYSAARRGGDLADGFLFGALVGAAAGAAGYALGAAVTGAIGGMWGSILGGAAEGAIVGAGNGATVGFAGGAGSWQEMLLNAAIGFGIGAVMGGLAGYLRYNPPNVSQSLSQRAGEMPMAVENPATGKPYLGPTGQPMTQDVPIPGQAGQFWQNAGNAAASTVGPHAQRGLEALLRPAVFAGVGTITHATVYHQWDALRGFLLDTFGGDQQQVGAEVPVGGS